MGATLHHYGHGCLMVLSQRVSIILNTCNIGSYLPLLLLNSEGTSVLSAPPYSSHIVCKLSMPCKSHMAILVPALRLPPIQRAAPTFLPSKCFLWPYNFIPNRISSFTSQHSLSCSLVLEFCSCILSSGLILKAFFFA